MIHTGLPVFRGENGKPRRKTSEKSTPVFHHNLVTVFQPVSRREAKTNRGPWGGGGGVRADCLLPLFTGLTKINNIIIKVK